MQLDGKYQNYNPKKGIIFHKNYKIKTCLWSDTQFWALLSHKQIVSYCYHGISNLQLLVCLVIFLITEPFDAFLNN